MSRISRGFDLLAPVYDRLAGLVFGKAILNAQSYWLCLIPPGSRVLILGGGTGKILHYLPGVPLKVFFLDISAGMIRKAKQRVLPSPEIKTFFICGSADSLDEKEFDVVITPFFLDLFDQKGAEEMVEEIMRMMTPEGIWLYTDFSVGKNSPHWQKLLLWLMYRFFRWVCAIPAKDSPDIVRLRNANHLVVRNKADFYRGMITSEVWTSSTHPSYHTSD